MTLLYNLARCDLITITLLSNRRRRVKNRAFFRLELPTRKHDVFLFIYLLFTVIGTLRNRELVMML